MTDAEIYEKIAQCFMFIFDEYEGEISPELTADAVAQWDSLSNVQFMVMIEQEFGFRFKSDEISGFRNMGALVDVIKERT